MTVFYVNYNMSERGLPTLFKYRYFTVDSKQRENWEYEKLEQYLGEYKLCIDNVVFDEYKKNSSVTNMLNELKKIEEPFIVSRNTSNRYEEKNQYIKCRIPLYAIKCLKNIFISTIVYDANKQEIPEIESISFKFDTESKTVTINKLNLFEPKDNPYFTYARNAVSVFSVETIGLDKYSIENQKDVKNFYEPTQVSRWKEVCQFEKEKDLLDASGVYMLYDVVNNNFYVGKAKNLGSRISTHLGNLDSFDKSYTHYRYSVVSREYYEFLYLIENAAIHDIAWIINMPSARRYTPSLSKITKALNECKMINNVEHQTRKQD